MTEQKKATKYSCVADVDIRSEWAGNITLHKGEITEAQFNRVKNLLPENWAKYVKAV